jgi:hypothetical protein
MEGTMKGTSGLIAMALGLLVLRGMGPARGAVTAGPATIHSNHSKTTILPAEDSGDDDGDDDGATGSGDSD